MIVCLHCGTQKWSSKLTFSTVVYKSMTCSTMYILLWQNFPCGADQNRNFLSVRTLDEIKGLVNTETNHYSVSVTALKQIFKQPFQTLKRYSTATRTTMTMITSDVAHTLCGLSASFTICFCCLLSIWEDCSSSNMLKRLLSNCGKWLWLYSS